MNTVLIADINILILIREQYWDLGVEFSVIWDREQSSEWNDYLEMKFSVSIYIYIPAISP